MSLFHSPWLECKIFNDSVLSLHHIAGYAHKMQMLVKPTDSISPDSRSSWVCRFGEKGIRLCQAPLAVVYLPQEQKIGMYKPNLPIPLSPDICSKCPLHIRASSDPAKKVSSMDFILQCTTEINGPPHYGMYERFWRYPSTANRSLLTSRVDYLFWEPAGIPSCNDMTNASYWLFMTFRHKSPKHFLCDSHSICDTTAPK